MNIQVKRGGVLWWKKYHFTIIAQNSEPVARSRKFKSQDELLACLNLLNEFFRTGIGLNFDMVRNLAIDEPYHFRILNIEGKVILWSENYHNRIDCIDTYNLIKKQMCYAKITPTK